MSEWISVKDRLPRERQVVVLGFFDADVGDINAGDDGDCVIQIGFVLKRLMGDGVFATVLAGAPDNHFVSLNLDAQPTHWMQLEPPEADND